ncbi:MAG: hypothetical protein ABFS45_01330 [Pseudomonadota bacterium]
MTLQGQLYRVLFDQLGEFLDALVVPGFESRGFAHSLPLQFPGVESV